MNELITNSIKHAFPKGRVGELVVTFNRINDDFELIVSDNGVGFPENINIENPETLGLQLVNSLVEQIDGKIELDTNHGTTIRIIFKK